MSAWCQTIVSIWFIISGLIYGTHCMFKCWMLISANSDNYIIVFWKAISSQRLLAQIGNPLEDS